jgi:hypothetical protein
LEFCRLTCDLKVAWWLRIVDLLVFFRLCFHPASNLWLLADSLKTPSRTSTIIDAHEAALIKVLHDDDNLPRKVYRDPILDAKIIVHV